MSESDTMFNERDWRCAAIQLMLSTDPSYDNRTIASILKMQIWIATNNRDMTRMMKTKFPATVMVFGVVSSEGHIMPPHIFEVGLKVNTKVYLDVLKSVGDLLMQSGGRWQTLAVVAGLGAGPQVQRDPGLASEGVLRLCTLLTLYMWVCMCVCLYAHVYVCVYMCVCVCVNVCMGVCVCTWMYVYVSMIVCMWAYMCNCMCMCVCM